MFKYQVQAYNYSANVGAVNEILVIVTAPNEEKAITQAQAIVPDRSNFDVISIEDLRGSEIKKKR